MSQALTLYISHMHMMVIFSYWPPSSSLGHDSWGSLNCTFGTLPLIRSQGHTWWHSFPTKPNRTWWCLLATAHKAITPMVSLWSSKVLELPSSATVSMCSSHWICRTERQHGIFTWMDACSSVLEISGDGNVLSIVTDCSLLSPWHTWCWNRCRPSPWRLSPHHW